MSVEATREALDAAGLEAAEVDAVVVATVTHPYQTPAAAPIVADRLGIRGAAFDISAACAGYCHGISLASDMVRGGSARHVLVVGVEKLSDFTDPTDRGSAFIFGDGAGAAVVGPSDTPGIGPTVWGSDGSQWQHHLPARLVGRASRESGGVGWPAIGMAGQSVFRWAVWGMAPVAQKALDAAGVRGRGPRRVHPAPGQHADHRRDDQAAQAARGHRRRPRHRRDRQHLGGLDPARHRAACCARARSRTAALALQIGFGAGLVYAAQVVVLP